MKKAKKVNNKKVQKIQKEKESNKFQKKNKNKNNIELIKVAIDEKHENELFDIIEKTQKNLEASITLRKFKDNLNKKIETQPRFTQEKMRSKTKTLSNMAIYLSNFKNSQYIARIGIGNPAQLVDIIFDTGSSNFWINSSRCKNQGCLMHESFNATKSKSYTKVEKKVEVEFGSGVIYGSFCKDTVKVGNLELPKQEFGEIEEMEGEIFNKLKFSGILGLSFPNLSTLNYVPFFDNLMKKKILDKNMFSFYLSEQNEKINSQIIFGEPDKKFYIGKIKWHKVTEVSYWQLGMEDLYMDGKKMNLCKPPYCKLVIDTGTSIITGPSEDLKKVLANIKLNNCDDFSYLPEIAIKIDNEKYTLNPQDYIIFPNKMKEDAEKIQKNKDNKEKEIEKVKEKEKEIENLNKKSNDKNKNKKSNINLLSVFSKLDAESEEKNMKNKSSFVEMEMETKVDNSLKNEKVKFKEAYLDLNVKNKNPNLNLNSESEEVKNLAKKKLICKRAFMPLNVDEPRGPLWVLGDLFLRKYFVVFDRDTKRIGIALRNKFKKSENVVDEIEKLEAENSG